MAKDKGGRPLTAGGRTLAIKGKGSGGPKGKKAAVWFQAGNNKGENKGKPRSYPGPSSC
jgi:hypothetical protein